MGAATRGLLVGFAGLFVSVMAGVAFIPAPSQGATGAINSGLWLIWMFALWGALVTGVIFLIAWGAEALRDQEQALQTQAPHYAEPPVQEIGHAA
jgi:hypothetical protein